MKSPLLFHSVEATKIKEIIKIIVDGDGGVGKTTMLKRLTEGQFDPGTPITIGLDFFVKDYYLFDQKVFAQFWDFVGASRFDVLRPTCYRGASSMVLVCDLTRIMTTTEERINYFLDVANSAGLESQKIILVGSKTDLYYERSVNPEYLALYRDQYNFHQVIEVSARSNNNLELLFEAAVALGMYNKGLVKKDEFEEYTSHIHNRIEEPYIEPHDKILRQCFDCHKRLLFYEFASTNPNYNQEFLVKLWKSPHVEILCCKCYLAYEEDMKKIRSTYYL
ncbi:MAG: Rab family GTPase [Promethearchaeota archaeon]